MMTPKTGILFVAIPATAENSGRVSDAVLDELQAGAVVVNISRDSVIDNEAMYRAMDRRVCYATDFPLPNVKEEWLGRYVSTNHVGGYTHAGLAMTERIAVDELLKRIDQEAVPVSN